ncbi:hypothetical protein [Streptomyces sp. NBC_01431]|uniref:hypothetical protein n=1 Tax=Streptomyces sp. NBC_01431 TaxID=2903863 RepID=UPI002E31B922|nr:hypothetical protein [Streptomyces sp. NBC_01431]
MDQHPEQIALGDVTVTRIKEFYGSAEMAPGAFFPDSPDGSWGRAPRLAGARLLEPAAAR